MRLTAITLKNLRSYLGEVRIPIDAGLTALVGRNDVGKSTVLDALAMFFGELKFDETDRCRQAAPGDEVMVGCAFADLPASLVLDRDSATTLADEHLLNAAGELEVHRVLGGKKDARYALALHPSAAGVDDLLDKKNAELKQLARQRGVAAQTDLRDNVALRQALWAACADLARVERRVSLTDHEGKAIWEQLQRALPMLVVFRTDRDSTDQDDECQEPLQAAINETVRELADDLDVLVQAVKANVDTMVADTNQTLRRLAPSLARDLESTFPTKLKWASLFNASLVGSDGILLNKRGSGARRMVLMASVLAFAGRTRSPAAGAKLLYALEEPETGLHPSLQRELLDALRKVVEQDGSQVLLTTHAPGLAGELPVASLRHLVATPPGRTCHSGGQDGAEALQRIAEDLGLELPANLGSPQLRLLICCEGPHDVTCLRALNRAARELEPSLPLFDALTDVALLPLGGSTLKHWVEHRYLYRLGAFEVHLYDGDQAERIQAPLATLGSRSDARALVMRRRAIENYLHPALIEQVFGVRVEVAHDASVPAALGRALGRSARPIKTLLNTEVAAAMTGAHLAAWDPDGEVVGWFRAFAASHERARASEPARAA